MTYSDVFRASRGDRVGVDNIAVAVTDGKSNVNSGSTIPRATEAKEAGNTVLLIKLKIYFLRSKLGFYVIFNSQGHTGTLNLDTCRSRTHTEETACD